MRTNITITPERVFISRSLRKVRPKTDQSVGELRQLARRLDEASLLEEHWPLLVEIAGRRDKDILQHFAHFVSAFWCAGASLPRNVGCNPAQQSKAHEKIVGAALALEKALRSRAAHPALCNTMLGQVHDTTTDQFGKPVAVTKPVVAIPLAEKKVESDSVLRRLIGAAKSTPVEYVAGLVSYPNRVGARETYFARQLALGPLMYASGDAATRQRIESFIAALITQLNEWEGSRRTWDAEGIRQSLRPAVKAHSVHPKKISS